MEEIAVEDFDRFLQHRQGDGGGAVIDFLQGQEIGFPAAGRAQEEEDHRRHEERARGPRLGEGGEDRRRIDLRHHHAPRPSQQTEEGPRATRDMEERRGDVHHLVVFPGDDFPAAHGGDAFEEGLEVAVGELYALGLARGARGVDLHHHVSGASRHLRLRLGARIAPVDEGRPALVPSVEHDDPFDRGDRVLDVHDSVGVFAGDDQQPGPRIGDDEGDLGRRQAEVDRCQHHAGLGGAESQVEEAVAVLGQQRHPVARHQAFGQQCVRHPIGPSVEFAVARLVAREQERDTLRSRAGPVAHDIRQDGGDGPALGLGHASKPPGDDFLHDLRRPPGDPVDPGIGPGTRDRELPHETIAAVELQTFIQHPAS